MSSRKFSSIKLSSNTLDLCFLQIVRSLAALHEHDIDNSAGIFPEMEQSNWHIHRQRNRVIHCTSAAAARSDAFLLFRLSLTEELGFRKQSPGFATRAIHIGQSPEQWNSR